MRTAVILIIGILILTGSSLLAAHHAFTAQFDENRPVSLKGTVTKFELINPHSWIWIDVKGADGKVVNWGIEGGTPNALMRRGFTKNSLPIGTEVVVVGFQARNGSNRAVGVTVNYSDGRKLFLGGSAPGAEGNETAR
jgi:hypothetical protein